MVLAVVLVFTFSLPAAATTQTRQERMISWVNHARDAHGVRPLESEYRITEIARNHSLLMSRTQSLYHSTDLSSNLSFINWDTYSENVGVGVSPLGLFQAFMRSDAHRQNILDSDLTHVGIAFARDDEMLWVTMIFYG
jgi:uncharacterized protein YkwD